jgi:hypothetical protein
VLYSGVEPQSNLMNPLLIRRSVFLFLTFCSFLSLHTFAQDSEIVTITGVAPTYVGQEIAVFEIEDFLSEFETQIASCKVKTDSTFELIFFLSETQKVSIKALNNKGFMYVEPGSTYSVFVPDKDPYSPKVKTGNLIEIAFFDLPSTDINYKILAFQRWNDEYMSRIFPYKNTDPKRFANKLDTFKIYVEHAYKSDSSVFFMTYVRFSIADLDEIEFAGSRNRYEKYDFYIKPSPVFYTNDAYMNYIERYYKNMVPRLSNETNNKLYLGVLKSSPTRIMQALGTEYSLQNLRIREYVMIQALSEQFYSDDFPQTNIMTILDSLSERAMFKEHRIIATNITRRLTELVSGAMGPNYILRSAKGDIRTNLDFKDRYSYIHFIDPASVQNQMELELLKKLYQKYNGSVEFVTIYLQSDLLTDKQLNPILKLPWPVYSSADNKDMLGKFQVRNFPHYSLIDIHGYIVASPALGPTPNAQYETIEKTFFYINKMYQESNER